MATQKYELNSNSRESGKSPGLGVQLHTSAGITQEQREHMIAEAAYYIAEHRHFQGGEPIHDWLLAQTEIDSKIKGAYR